MEGSKVRNTVINKRGIAVKMGFLKQGGSGALAAVMIFTSGGLCIGQSVTFHAQTKAKTYTKKLCTH